MIVSALLVLCVTLFIAAYAKHRREVAKYAHIPGHSQFLPFLPIYIPFLNPYPFYSYTLVTKYIMPCFLDMRKKYNTRTFKLTAFCRTVVLTCDTEDAKKILRKYHSFVKQESLYDGLNVFGPNIISLNGDAWKLHRNIANRSFTHEHLKYVAQISAESTEQMLHQLEKEKMKNGEVELDVREDFNYLTLDIVGKTLFGTDFQIFSDTQSKEKLEDNFKFMKSVEQFTSLRIPLRAMIGEAPWKFPILNRVASCDEIMLQKVKTLMEQRKKTKDVAAYHDLLSYLIMCSNGAKSPEEEPTANGEDEEEAMINSASGAIKLSDQEITADIFMMLVAGHETTATALQWFFAFIAQHPEIQQKIVDEIDTKLQGRMPVYEDYTELTYLVMCMHESMRLSPPVTYVSRQLRCGKEKETLSGYAIPTDTEVNLCFYAIHRDELNWEDPYKFNPDRFKEMDQISPFKYLPFSAGPRKCVGYMFSLKEQFIILAKLFQYYTVKFTEETAKEVAKHGGKFEMPVKEFLEVTIKPSVSKFILQKRTPSDRIF